MKEISTAAIIESAQKALFPNYRRLPIVFCKGQGTRVWDRDGNEYTDFVAGIATCNLGHCHPEVVKAICDQAGRLMHVSNWYYSDVQAELSSELTSTAQMDRVFFCNSGAEASETAIKLARKMSYDTYGPNRNRIIGFQGAFHGRTMKALTATDPKYHIEAFSPYPEGFVHIRPGDIEALKKQLPGACAVFLEPVQGEGGVRPMDRGFLEETARLCREQDVLIMFDEVQTGMGRCGTLFAHQALGIKPDIMTLAKGLANGFPMGAVLAREEVGQVLGPGTHGSTFGGNPLACSAALATLRVMTRDDIPSKALRMGAILRSGLEDLGRKHPIVKEVRGMGLLLGMELNTAAAPFVKDLLDRGYLATVVAENTLRFTPALIISVEEIQALLEALDKSISGGGGSN